MKEENNKIISRQIEEELKKSYMEYSMSVIVSRALPDVRDGLKPSQRRILYAMHELNLAPGGHFRKCAKIAGDTSGNYHPHGEQVVYPTLVRLSQEWSMRYPLINGQGNFGSIDGDPPAAMRYTEARLHKTAIDLMLDIEKDTVDYKGNYDETRKEPTVFPTRLPNLLINGSTGIAVGMATNMAPHNLGEVCDGITAVIDNPELTDLELMQHIPGPDFPTGGFIVGRSAINDYVTTGRGKLKVRGKADIHTNKKSGQESIIISEIPYMLNKTLLIEKIASLVKEKRIEGISDIRDESGRDGMRLVIFIKRNADANVVLNKLYKYTQLQGTFGVISLALVDGVPQVLTLRQLLDNFIDFRHQVVIRRTKYELARAEARLHILEGLRIALDNIDEIIATIRSSASTPEARDNLMAKFTLSEIQAKAILEMRLQKLTGLERDKIENEYKELSGVRDHLNAILESREMQMDIIKAETKEMKDKYPDPRRTQIIDNDLSLDMEDLIPEENVVVTITKEGYIKRMPVDLYKTQGRGGRGLSGSNLKDTDFIQKIFVVSTHAYILFFTDFGKCYWLKVYQVPSVGRHARGKAIVNLINIEKDENIKAFVTVREFDETRFIVMSTRNGLLKKTPLNAYSRPRTNGIKAIKLVDGDELLSAKITSGKHDIILATHNGYCNRFSETATRPLGRNSQGVCGIKLREEDFVVSMIVVAEDDKGTILSISENGYGKRTSLDQYKTTNRGTKGVITLKTTMRNGYLVKLLEISDEDDLMITTRGGMIIRQQGDSISSIGRNTQGVRLINLHKKDKVFDATTITNEPEEEEVIDSSSVTPDSKENNNK
ncbi:MAG: DNA gyrase subunit A [Candidatus Cloacimonetes bacterium 4572_65]|nr:MAG: DNA gyrase subunit A [Candidatus Cloacimonetes bacterium 4572_65]